VYLLPQSRKPPAAYQDSIFKHGPEPVANIKPLETRRDSQSNRLELLKAFDQAAEERSELIDPLELASSNYELACRMQVAVPELTRLEDETTAMRTLYGLHPDFGPSKIFGG
jgi:hypothetical protein